MKSKGIIAASAVLAAMAIAWVVVGSRAVASDESEKAEILALNDRLNDAIGRKDLDAAMACYLDDKDAVFYEDTVPFQLNGKSALREYDQQFFQSASPIRAGMEAVAVVVSGDLAVARYTAPLSWSFETFGRFGCNAGGARRYQRAPRRFGSRTARTRSAGS